MRLLKFTLLMLHAHTVSEHQHGCNNDDESTELVGYDDAVDETARLTDSRLELTEDEANELNASLNRIIAALDEQPCVRVTYFVPDAKKSGGRYIEKVGTARTFNEYTNELIFTDGDAIAVEDMCAAEITEQPES